METIEPAILEAETRVETIDAMFAEPDFYEKHGANAEALTSERDDLQTKLEELFARWEELEKIRQESQKS